MKMYDLCINIFLGHRILYVKNKEKELAKDSQLFTYVK